MRCSQDRNRSGYSKASRDRFTWDNHHGYGRGNIGCTNAGQENDFSELVIRRRKIRLSEYAHAFVSFHSLISSVPPQAEKDKAELSRRMLSQHILAIALSLVLLEAGVLGLVSVLFFLVMMEIWSGTLAPSLPVHFEKLKEDDECADAGRSQCALK
jgi:hypothetical protein